MKPWEEAWSAHDTDDDGDDFNILRSGNWNDPVVERGMCPGDAKLAAAAPEMARVLLLLHRGETVSAGLVREALRNAGVIPSFDEEAKALEDK